MGLNLIPWPKGAPARNCSQCNFPATHALVLSDGDQRPVCVACIQSGRVGYLPEVSIPPGQPAASLPPDANRPGVVVVAVDGDTLALRAHLEDGTAVALHVRVLGIDAPEAGTAEGTAATKAVGEMLAKVEGRVRLEADPAHPTRDRYGRLLRHAFAGDRLVAAELVARRLAVVDDRFPPTKYDADLRDASRAAAPPPAAPKA